MTNEKINAIKSSLRSLPNIDKADPRSNFFSSLVIFLTPLNKFLSKIFAIRSHFIGDQHHHDDQRQKGFGKADHTANYRRLTTRLTHGTYRDLHAQSH